MYIYTHPIFTHHHPCLGGRHWEESSLKSGTHVILELEIVNSKCHDRWLIWPGLLFCPDNVQCCGFTDTHDYYLLESYHFLEAELWFFFLCHLFVTPRTCAFPPLPRELQPHLWSIFGVASDLPSFPPHCLFGRIAKISHALSLESWIGLKKFGDD